MPAKTGAMDQDLGLYNVLTGRASAAKNATTLLAAIADPLSADRMITLSPTTWTLNADVTVPATRGLFVPKGAVINKNGHALIVQGPLWVSHDDTSWHTGAGSFKWTHKQFTQSGGVNVKEYGARVDGVTDDTAALNTCLAENTHVFIPEGVLLHSGAIVLNIGNRLSGTWTGADAATKTDAGASLSLSGSSLHYTGSGVAVEHVSSTLQDGQILIDHLQVFSGGGMIGIHLKGVVDIWLDFVSVCGLTFPLTTQGFSVAAVHLEAISGSPGFVGVGRVSNSMLRYAAGMGLRIDGGNNLNAWHIHGNRIQGNGICGLYAEGQAMGWNISGNDIEGNGSSFPTGGTLGKGSQLYASYPTAWNIQGNYMEPPVGTSAPIIRLERAQGVGIHKNILFGNPTGTRTPYLVQLGNLGTGIFAKSVTLQGNRFANAVAAVHPEFVQGLTICDNSVFFNVDREISTVVPCVIEGFSYQSMTYDSPIGGNPDTVIESTPTIAGMNTQAVSFASSTVETTVYTAVIPGKTVQASTNMAGGFMLELHGSLLNNSGGPLDMTIRVKFGGVVQTVLRWQAVAVNGSPRVFVLRGRLYGSMGFPGNQAGWYEGLLGDGDTVKNTVIDGGITPRFGGMYAGTTGVDMAVDQTLLVTAQLSVSHASASFAKESAWLMRIPY